MAAPGACVVSNASNNPVTVGANTIPARSVRTLTLGAADADSFLAGGCAVVQKTPAHVTRQEAAFQLYRQAVVNNG